MKNQTANEIEPVLFSRHLGDEKEDECVALTDAEQV